VLQCVAVCCSVLQCAAASCSTVPQTLPRFPPTWYDPLCVCDIMCVCDMVRDVTHSYVRRDVFICETWRIHVCDVTYSCARRDSFVCVTRLIHMCDMTHSCVWHDLYICVVWLLRVCDMTYIYVWYDSFMSVASCMLWMCGAVCCSVLQCVAVCCSVLQCVTSCMLWMERRMSSLRRTLEKCKKISKISALQQTAIHCNVLQRIARSWIEYWKTFSKVSSKVILYGYLRSILTIENCALESQWKAYSQKSAL